MKFDIQKITNNVRITLSKRSPEILTGLGTAGIIIAGLLTVKGTVNAVRKVDKVKEEKGVETLTKKEVVKETYKYYIAPSAITLVSIGCIIGASATNHKRNVALATAYGLSEKALTDYKEEVSKVLGPKKLKEVEEKAAIAKMVPVPEESMIINTGKGQTLCLDAVSGRYFRSDINEIKSVINEINFRLRSEMYTTLNDLYYDLGLPAIAIGGELGWNIDDGGIEAVFGSALTDNGTPCLVLDYCVEPKYDYRTKY